MLVSTLWTSLPSFFPKCLRSPVAWGEEPRLYLRRTQPDHPSIKERMKYFQVFLLSPCKGGCSECTGNSSQKKFMLFTQQGTNRRVLGFQWHIVLSSPHFLAWSECPWPTCLLTYILVSRVDSWFSDADWAPLAGVPWHSAFWRGTLTFLVPVPPVKKGREARG